VRRQVGEERLLSRQRLYSGTESAGQQPATKYFCMFGTNNRDHDAAITFS
jgi:hypothetical protein